MTDSYSSRVYKRLLDFPPDNITDPFGLCREIHSIAREIPLVDSFYIGFYDSEIDQLGFPYTADLEILDTAEYRPIDVGAASEVIRTGKPYILSPQTAKGYKPGRRFGHVKKRSKSAIHMPMFADKTGDVVGVIAILSYTENAFDSAVLAVMEKIAEIVARPLIPFAQKDSTRELRIKIAEQGTLFHASLQELHERLNEISDIPKRNAYASNEVNLKNILELVNASKELCKEIQARVAYRAHEISFLQDKRRVDLLRRLTRAQREVAELVGTGTITKAIALELSISEATVRTHIGAASERLGVQGREGLYNLLSPFYERKRSPQ